MARQNLENSTPSVRVKMGVQRAKINENFTEIYEGKVDKETGKSLVSTAEKANWNAKQDPLTLKTVNGESIVGTGNIVVSGGGGNVASVNGILPDGAKNVALTTDNIPQTSEKQYVSTTDKSNWNGASIGSDLGLLKTTDTPPPTGTHKGDVNSAGTYTNFKTAAAVSIVFTAPELADNYGFIYVVDNVATKSLVAKKGGLANGIVEKENLDAVSGGEVYSKLHTQAHVKSIFDSAFEDNSVISKDVSTKLVGNFSNGDGYVNSGNIFHWNNGTNIKGDVYSITAQFLTAGIEFAVYKTNIATRVSTSIQTFTTVLGMQELVLTTPISMTSADVLTFKFTGSSQSFAKATKYGSGYNTMFNTSVPTLIAGELHYKLNYKILSLPKNIDSTLIVAEPFTKDVDLLDTDTATSNFTAPYATFDGTLKNVSIKCTSGSKFIIRKINKETMVSEAITVVTATVSGYNTWEMPNILVTKGEYITFAIVSGTGSFYKNIATGFKLNFQILLSDFADRDGELAFKVGYAPKNIVDFINSATNNLGEIWIDDEINTFVGDKPQIFKDAIFSGLLPNTNYYIAFEGESGFSKEYARYFEINTLTTAIGTYDLKIAVYDLNHKMLTTKTIKINHLAKPTSVLPLATSSDKAQILFIGDSLIHHNQNLIGKEFVRMLTTSGSEVIDVDGSIKLKPLNLAPDKIELVGRLGVDSTDKYDVLQKLGSVSGKNTNPVNLLTYNPFLDSTKTTVDTLDSQGFNINVDMVKYFEDMCGTGKHPDYIVMSGGVNDMALEFSWKMTQEKYDIIVERLRVLLLKYKSAATTIGGVGNNLKVVIMTHQFYPIKLGSSQKFDNMRQRQMYVKLYGMYKNLVKNNPDLSSFVTVLNCGCYFDMDYNYTLFDKNVNSRNSVQEKQTLDTVHMSSAGAYAYSDALIRHFVSRTDFK